MKLYNFHMYHFVWADQREKQGYKCDALWADQREKQGYKSDVSLKRGIQISSTLGKQT